MPRDIAELWLDYNRAKSELAKALGREDDVVSAIGDIVVAEAYDVVPLTAGQSETMQLDDGRIIETRSAKRAKPGPIQLPAIEDWDFDVLVMLVFDEEGYIESASEIAVAQAREVAKFDRACNYWCITLDDGLQGRGFVQDVSDKISKVYNGGFSRSKTDESEGDGKPARRIDPLSVMRNKEFAMKCIQLLKDGSPTLDADISALTDAEYCKQVLEHSFAILKCVTGMSLDGVKVEARDRHGNRRYYESPIPIGDESYIVSNDWYGLGVGGRDNRTPFIKWVRERV